MKTPEEIAAEILAASPEEKARTLDHIARHLAKAATNDPRDRERARAGIALRQIAGWVKTPCT